MEALVELYPKLPEEVFSKYGVTMTGFDAESSVVHFEGTSAKDDAWTEVKALISSAVVTKMSINFPLALLASLKKFFHSCDILTYVKPVQQANQVILCSFDKFKHDEAVRTIHSGPFEVVVRVSQSDVELLANDQQKLVKEIEAEMSVAITMKQKTDVEQTMVFIRGFCQNDVHQAHKRLLTSLEERRSVQKLTPEQIMYLNYQYQTSPDIFLGIQIEFRKGNQICGSPEALHKIVNGPILDGLKWKRYPYNCFPRYEQQIIRCILRPLKEKDLDFVYLVDKAPFDIRKSRQSSTHELIQRRFDIIVYSKNPTAFLQVCASLDDIKPMSKRYGFRHSESVQYVRSIKSKLETTYHVHISENDREARINGLKQDDVQKCWEDIDEGIKSSVVIVKTIAFTKHESNFLKEKHSGDLKLQFACDIFHGKDRITLYAKGKIRDVEALERKISEILETGVHNETFTVSCPSGQYSMWNKWWNDVKRKQEGSQIMIKYFRKDRRHSKSGPSSKAERVAEVEFDVVGTDKEQVSGIREALCSQEVEERSISLSPSGASSLLTAKVQGRLNFLDKLAVTIFIDKKASTVELACPRGLAEDLDIAEQEIQRFVGNHASVQRVLKCTEPVVGLVLSSKTKSIPYLMTANSIAKDNKVSVHVLTAPLVGLRLTGNVAAVDRSKPIIDTQVLKKIEATVKQTQLIVNQKQSSLLSTPEFYRFESKLKEEYCIICSYPRLGKQSKAAHSAVIQSNPSARPVQLDICHGNIVEEKIAAIVNAANEDLRHAGGLAKAIVDAGGPDIQTQSSMHVQFNGKVFPGTCVALGAGELPCKRVIHAVGPRWVDGSKGEEQILYLTVYNCLQCANDQKLDGIAFPAIGTGIFQVPEDICARTSLRAVQDYFRSYPNSTVILVRFILFTPSSFQSFSTHFKYMGFSSAPSKPTVPLKPTVLLDVGSKPIRGSAYQWLWANDSGSFSAYPPDIVNQLNKAYQKNPQGSSLCLINRHAYIIDFATMTQVNISTRNKRNVRIESSRLSTATHAVHWEYANDEGSWSPYQSQDSRIIEAQHQMNSPTCTLNIRSQTYQLDFTRMCQINMKTGNTRKIRRVTPTSRTISENQGKLPHSRVRHASSPAEDVTVLLRGPGDCLQQAKQKFTEKLKSMFKSHSVTFPAALERKLQQIIRKHSVTSSVRDVTKGSQRKPQKVIVIEGLASKVDRAITAVQEAVIQNQLDTEEDDTTQYPPEWEQQIRTTQVFQVQRGTPEWNRVITAFQKTMPRSKVTQITRIQNKWLWEKYVFHQKRLGIKNNGVVNELELFHGTRSNDPKVIYENEDGFDMRYSAEGMWGQANYFAVNASYSHIYAHSTSDGAREMFLVKVLTGDSYNCQPNNSLRKPPMKSSGISGEVSFAQMQYDTVTGITNGSRVYMTYDNDKAYPAYLIKYC